MSKTFFKMSLGLLAAAGMVWPSLAALPGMRTLHGHVPAVVAHLTSTGQLPATNTLHLAIGLPLRNQAALDALMKQIYDPSSASYHHFLTPEEFTANFGPTEQDFQKVVDFAKANGLTVTRAHGNRMLLEVTGKASDVESAFKVTLHKYRHPTENRDFFAPDQEPSVPAELSVLDVSGLSSYSRPHSFMRLKPLTAKAASATPLAGSAPDGTSYMGYDYRKAYVPGTTLTGAGQKIALVQFDGYFSSDIAAYQQLTGLPALSITNILLDGFNGNPTLTGGEGEVELDIEMVNSWAPGLSQLLVYEENPNVFNPVVVLNQIAMDNAAKQISCSWSLGVAPSGSGTINQILQQMALQGQSFFQASGDSDALLPGEADDQNGFFGICCNPYLTSVGGTKLFTDAGGNYTSEAVWNDRTPNYGQGGDWGSGGGISTFYSTPTWQVGFGTATNHGSTTGRNFPDVALPAEDVYVVIDGQAQASGGTSAAAPAWAGFMALVNQQVALNGRLPIGFLNPTIYAIANTAAYTNCFHDTTTGDNTWPGSPTNFFAVAGYDLCTGLGTPNGNNLISALVAAASTTPPKISAPPPFWGNTLSVMNGGNPNGPWFLFIQDDLQANSGVISNGWFVTLTTANPVGNVADNAIYATPTNQPLQITVNTYWNLSLAVTNYGPSASSNVFVTDTLPVGPGITLVSSNVTLGSVSQSGSPLTWTLGNLATNAGAVLNLSFYVTSAGTFTNTAVVGADTMDPNPDDDSVTSLVTATTAVPPQLTLPPGGAYGPGGFHFSISGSAVPTVIQASTNLLTTNWIAIYTNTPPFTFTNFNATNFPMRFYRAVTSP